MRDGSSTVTGTVTRLVKKGTKKITAKNASWKQKMNKLIDKTK